MTNNLLFPPLPRYIKVPFFRPYHNIISICIGALKKNKEKQIITFLKKTFNIRKNILLTDSGTSALYLALKDIGLKKTDEVIIPSFVCKAVINAVIAAGGRPVFVDIGRDFNMSIKSIKKTITKKTRVIIAVHQYGKTCQIAAIAKICTAHKLLLIEDSAITLGIKHHDTYVGNYGDYAVFSFNIGKTATAFGGGALILQNTKRIKRICSSLLRPKNQFFRYIFFITNIYYKKIFAVPFTLLVKIGIIQREEDITQLYKETNKKKVVIKAYQPTGIQEAAILYQLRKLTQINSNQKKTAEIYNQQQ